MANRQRGQQIAPMIRGAFIRAAKGLEAKGKPLSTLIAKELEERPLDTLRAIAGFVPKEMLVETTFTQKVEEMTDAQLAARIHQLIATTGIGDPAGSEGAEVTH